MNNLLRSQIYPVILLQIYKLRDNKTNPSGQRSGFPFEASRITTEQKRVFRVPITRIVLLCLCQTFHAVTIVFTKCCGSMC